MLCKQVPPSSHYVAANAEIGVAKAAYFPSISLTGTAGFQSDALTRLFTAPAGLWTAGPSLTQPIFEGGRIRSNVRLTEAQKQQELLTYESTIQEAFRELSDSLIAYQKDRQFREQQGLLTTAAQGAARLSDIRYRGGTASYLEVLTNDTNYFSAELTLVQAQLNERLALVQLYQALGGGWQQWASTIRKVSRKPEKCLSHPPLLLVEALAVEFDHIAVGIKNVELRIASDGIGA